MPYRWTDGKLSPEEGKLLISMRRGSHRQKIDSINDINLLGTVLKMVSKVSSKEELLSYLQSLGGDI